MKKQKVYTIVLSILLVLTLIFIWGNSIIPQSESKIESDTAHGTVKVFLDFIFGKDVITQDIFRKLAHFCEFMFLSLIINLLYLNLKKYNYKKIFEISSLCLFTAVIDESIQILSNRGPSVLDVLIDFSGSLFAVMIITLIYAIYKKVKNNERLQ